MPVQPAALELLSALAPVLARWGRWYVFGAQAVIVCGVPRLSADVDITLALVPDEPERFARDMEAAGFALRVNDPDFVRRTRVMPFVHGSTGMPLDVVLAGSGLEDEFLDRAVTMDVGGTTAPAPSSRPMAFIAIPSCATRSCGAWIGSTCRPTPGSSSRAFRQSCPLLRTRSRRFGRRARETIDRQR